MVHLTFDFTPEMGSDSADRLSYALRDIPAQDTVHVLVAAGDTDRVGPLFRVLEKRGYAYSTKGDAAGGLSITARHHEAQ